MSVIWPIRSPFVFVSTPALAPFGRNNSPDSVYIIVTKSSLRDAISSSEIISPSDSDSVSMSSSEIISPSDSVSMSIVSWTIKSSCFMDFPTAHVALDMSAAVISCRTFAFRKRLEKLFSTPRCGRSSKAYAHRPKDSCPLFNFPVASPCFRRSPISRNRYSSSFKPNVANPLRVSIKRSGLTFLTKS